jgi:hypothetical protein
MAKIPTNAQKMAKKIELIILAKIEEQNEKAASLAKAADTARASGNWEAAGQLCTQLASCWAYRDGLYAAKLAAMMETFN